MTVTQTLLQEPTADAPPAGPLVADRYELGAEINRGGMGVVYAARDRTLGRDVAVKVLRPELADRPRVVARFVEEARIAAQLQHPGIAPVHDLGVLPDGRPFLAMKLIKGRTLADLLKERAAPSADLPRFLSIFEAVCQAVGYAHAKGVIHRDLKPANVMVGAFGEVQVMDWGLAKTPGPPDGDRLPTDDPPGTVIDPGRDPDSHTQAGSLMGTPAYMPPEQAKGEVEKIDQRADVFALGAVLCEVLTGQPPYVGSFAEVKAQAVMGLTGPALGRLDAVRSGREMLDLCRVCMQTDRDLRPKDAIAVVEEAVAIRTEVAEFERTTEIDRARIVEKMNRRVTKFCAISIAADLQGDGHAASRWLMAAAASVKSPETNIRGFGRSLDLYGRPDLAHLLVERCVSTFHDWTSRPELGWTIDLAWTAVRWASGVDTVPPPEDPSNLAKLAISALEADLRALESAEGSVIKAWIEQFEGRMTRTDGMTWLSCFGCFVELKDRWQSVLQRVRELGCG
jgi:serine/threonine protein kinase